MALLTFKSLILASSVLTTASAISNAAIVVTEAHSTGSASVAYASDWFELANTGAAAVDITGWGVDDSSNSFTTTRFFRGVTSIPAGGKAIFIEASATNVNDATKNASFITEWFGGNAPAGFLIGNYGGSGIGLSSDGDAVNIFNATGTLITGVTFGAATVGVSFDNTAGLTGAISTLSQVGVNGAFTSTAGEIGSPGVIVAPVPEPTSLGLVAAAGLMALRRRRAI